MGFLEKLVSAPLWYLLLPVMVAASIGVTVVEYNPMMFDTSVITPDRATAEELETIDAAEIEDPNAAVAGTPANIGGVAAPVGTNDVLADGTYTGYAPCGVGNSDRWKPYYVGVTIDVKDGKVAAITKVFGSSTGGAGSSPLAWDAAENQSYLNWAISGKSGQTGVVNQINYQLKSSKTVNSIDTVSSATYSSVAIYNAYMDAVGQAAKKGAQKADELKVEDDQGESEHLDAEVPAGVLADGTYTAFAPCGIGNEEEWSPYYVGVTVRVEDGKVVEILDIFGSTTGEEGQEDLNWLADENQAYLDWASNGRTRGGKDYVGVRAQIEAALESGEQPSGIDTVSGATYSAEAIFKAYYGALQKAAAAANSTIELPGGTSDDATQSDSQTSGGGTDEAGGADSTGQSGDENQGSASGDGTDSGSDDAGNSGQSGEDGRSTGEDTPQVVVTTVNGVPLVGAFLDGTYTGTSFCYDHDSKDAWSPYYLIVTVEASGGKIVRITNITADSSGAIDPNYRYDRQENGTYLNRAINGIGIRTPGIKARIQKQLDEGSNVTTVDTVSAATWSSVSIYEAFVDAVSAANASVPHEG